MGLYLCIVLVMLMLTCWLHRAMLVQCFQLKGGVCLRMCCQTVFFEKIFSCEYFISLASDKVGNLQSICVLYIGTVRFFSTRYGFLRDCTGAIVLTVCFFFAVRYCTYYKTLFSTNK